MDDITEFTDNPLALIGKRGVNLPADGEILLICSDPTEHEAVARWLAEQEIGWSNSSPERIKICSLEQMNDEDGYVKRLLLENLIFEHNLSYRLPQFSAFWTVVPLDDMLANPVLRDHQQALLAAGISEALDDLGSTSDILIGVRLPSPTGQNQYDVFMQFLHWLMVKTSYRYHLAQNTFS